MDFKNPSVFKTRRSEGVVSNRLIRCGHYMGLSKSFSKHLNAKTIQEHIEYDFKKKLWSCSPKWGKC